MKTLGKQFNFTIKDFPLYHFNTHLSYIFLMNT